MSVSDHDILRQASLWLDRHGAIAVAEARKMAAGFQETGDRDSADIWLRILLALETLRGPIRAA
ncbi:MAG TPA: hypothetical protein VKQ29_12745 [Aliidongia sp.]|nr:hypothetical protein [Aliidongia sp.]